MSEVATKPMIKKMILQAKYEVISRVETSDAIIEVIQYPILRGSSDMRTAETLFFASQAGIRLKMIRIQLKNSKVRVEPGALFYMKGQLEMKASTGGGLIKGLARKVTSGESFFINEIHGTGVIYLEPTFGHFFLYDMTKDDVSGVICDKGMFYAGTSNLDIGASMQKNISAGLLGGEGWWQTSIEGTGIAVLFSPVPIHEVNKINLVDEKLSVDGNFALMRTTGINFKTEKSSKSWVSTSVSGEGMLQTFSGTGSVWLAPTQGIYKKMTSVDGLHELAVPPGSMGTNTNMER